MVDDRHLREVADAVPAEGGRAPEAFPEVAAAAVVTLSQVAEVLFAVVFVLFALGVGGLFALLGLLVIRSKYGIFRQWFQVKSTPPMSVQSAPVGEVNLEGKLQSAGTEPTTSPFTETPCAYACWEIAERTGDNWVAIAAGDTGPVRLVDGTGDILVRPRDPDIHEADDIEPSVRRFSVSGAAVEDRTEYSIVYDAEGYRAAVKVGEERIEDVRVGSRETPPEGIAEWCERAGVDPEGSSRRRYRELRIPEGETGYVQGQARRHAAGEQSATTGDLVVSGADDSAGLLLADRPESELVDLLAWEWRGRFLLGAFLFLLGVIVAAGFLVAFLTA